MRGVAGRVICERNSDYPDAQYDCVEELCVKSALVDAAPQREG